jgi:NAD(P)-dependent dehydrogenase (short-subunit alcohol dehydrogenase family)
MVTGSRVAVVTGASSGIGAAIAARLAENGLQVYGASRKTPAQVVDGVTHVAVDVTDEESVRTGVSDIIDDAGQIDVLVNNAGYLCAGAVEEVSIGAALAQFATNYFGAVRMIQAVLPTMRARRSGHLITISSLAGLVPVPFWGHYNASKFAIEALMETLRHEVRPFAIKVAMVEPGSIKTPFYEAAPVTGIEDYAGPRGRALQRMADYEATAPGPQLVADKVAAIVDDQHPKLRNTITREAKQFTALRRWLPARSFEAGVRRGFNLADR